MEEKLTGAESIRANKTIELCKQIEKLLTEFTPDEVLGVLRQVEFGLTEAVRDKFEKAKESHLDRNN